LPVSHSPTRSLPDARKRRGRTDAGLRRIFLASLDRDLTFAAISALDVVAPTDWRSVERRWFDARDGRHHGVIVTLPYPAQYLTPVGRVEPSGAGVPIASMIQRRAMEQRRRRA
jgi:hypothetical protein